MDGTERGVRRARLFAFLTVLSSLIGLVVYLISRPEGGKALACPGCGGVGLLSLAAAAATLGALAVALTLASLPDG